MLRLMCYLLACVSASAAAPSYSQSSLTSDPIHVLRTKVTLQELPAAVRERLAPTASVEQLNKKLRQTPEIIVDGGVINVLATRKTPLQTLMTKRLELVNGGEIITHGNNIEIDALEISSKEGQITAFTKAELTRSAAAAGENGEQGLNAGTVIIYGALANHDVMRVALAGQPGQPGGAGVAGTRGAPGPRGDNAADHLFDCAHGGGNGGNGGQGAAGGNGGKGGNGGAGGKLVLRGQLAAQRLQIDFAAPGGAGGRGGAPGPGGSGGLGGQGGRGSAYCRGGNPGADGPPGPPGTAGASGANGELGTLSSD